MKTIRFILILVSLISVSAVAQTKLNIKTDSLVKSNDTILTKHQNQLKIDNLFGNENHRFIYPGNKSWQRNPNLAFVPNNRHRFESDPNFKMPVLKPNYQSKMPVMKPDSSIHYHLLIKKYDNYIVK